MINLNLTWYVLEHMFPTYCNKQKKKEEDIGLLMKAT